MMSVASVALTMALSLTTVTKIRGNLPSAVTLS